MENLNNLFKTFGDAYKQAQDQVREMPCYRCGSPETGEQLYANGLCKQCNTDMNG